MPHPSPQSPEAARERRKAGRTGRLVLWLALPVLLIAVASALAGLAAMVLMAAGLVVALGVVGAMLYFDSQRQRRRTARDAVGVNRPPTSRR